MKKLVGILVIVLCVLYVMISQRDENTIVIYSALEQYRNDDISEQLKREFKDLNIRIMYMPTAKIGAKIKTEKETSDADIILGVETGYLEQIKDSLIDVSVYSHQQYIDGISPEDGKYLIWESYGGGFAVNTEVLKKHGLPEPKTYDDLLKPEYKNLIVLQDPKSSSTGYNFYLNRVNTIGLEKTIKYYDELNKNVKQYSESGSGPVKMLIQGECGIATALTYQVVTEMNRGNPLKMIYPPEGSPYSLDGLSIVKGHEKRKGVEDVFEYLANDALLLDKEKYNPGRILVDQKGSLENYPEDIEYADMSHIDDLELKDKLLNNWKY